MARPLIQAKPTARLVECRCSHRELATVLTTTMTTVGLPDTFTYAAGELVSCLIVSSARAYGSEVSSSHERGRDRRARAPDVHYTKDFAWSPMRQTTREKLDLNMPLTSRNILVEMVVRGGIEPPAFRFSG
jgi:hypothetical protein